MVEFLRQSTSRGINNDFEGPMWLVHGNLQNLPIGRPLLQSVIFIQKFAL